MDVRTTSGVAVDDLTARARIRDAAIEAFGFPQTFEACLRVTKAAVVEQRVED